MHFGVPGTTENVSRGGFTPERRARNYRLPVFVCRATRQAKIGHVARLNRLGLPEGEIVEGADGGSRMMRIKSPLKTASILQISRYRLDSHILSHIERCAKFTRKIFLQMKHSWRVKD